MPRGPIQVSPGDSGSLTQEWSNSTDEGEPGGDAISDARAYLVAPPFMIQNSSLSKTGPVVIRPGESYMFDIRYEIARSAPHGCFRAFTKLATDEAGIYPDPDDDPSPVDFVVLPSTGSPGRLWTRIRSSLDCRHRLAAAERPDRRTKCRKIVRELGTSVAPQGIVLWFTEGDRTRSRRSLASVVAEAQAGSVPAALELGYRNSRAAKRALRSLATERIESVVVEEVAKEDIYECEDRAPRAAARRSVLRQASRQALARLGDSDWQAAFLADLGSRDEDRVKSAVAAWAYIGEGKSLMVLGRALLDPEFPVTLRFDLVRALAAVSPQEAARINEAHERLEDRVEAWRAWASQYTPR